MKASRARRPPVPSMLSLTTRWSVREGAHPPLASRRRARAWVTSPNTPSARCAARSMEEKVPALGDRQPRMMRGGGCGQQLDDGLRGRRARIVVVDDRADLTPPCVAGCRRAFSVTKVYRQSWAAITSAILRSAGMTPTPPRCPSRRLDPAGATGRRTPPDARDESRPPRNGLCRR